MKPMSAILFLLLVVLAVGFGMMNRGTLEIGEKEFQADALQTESPVSSEPFASRVPTEVDPPAVVEEGLQPVQPLEERGDAMLFEIDALYGTPFDQAVVMPFE